MVRTVAALCFSMLLALPAYAARIPALSGGRSSINLKFVRYTGGTNGKIIVDLHNKGQQLARFLAKGLFFVPTGDPEKAPQRLGAAGPFDVRQQQGWQVKQSLTLYPGQKTRVRLQVFCIDSHRSSPTASHRFRLGKKRLPKKLRNKISTGTKRLIKAKGSAPRAKDAVQSHVWKSRNAKWIKLEGERKNERGSQSSDGPSQRQRRQMRPVSPSVPQSTLP